MAEVISVAIDISFQKAHPKLKFLRHVDDVWFGARSEHEAKKTLAQYRVELRNFELDINDLKTNIRSFSFLKADEWPQRLRILIDEMFDPTSSVRELDAFIQYYSYSFEVANKENDEGIIKYAIKLLDTHEAWDVEGLWPYLEKYLAACATSFPHSIDYVAQILSWKKRTGKELDKKLWSKIFNEIVYEHAPRQNDHEVAWALWGIWELKIKVMKKPIEAVLEFCGDIPLILAYHLIDKKRYTKKPAKTVNSAIDYSSSLNEHWLFLHEASINGWLGNEHKFVYDHKFLKDLRVKKVSFFDPEAEPPTFAEFASQNNGGDDNPEVAPSRALSKRNSLYEDPDEEEPF